MVPLNPVDDETETELEPEDPGAEMATDDRFNGIAAKNPGVIANESDCVVLLRLKLASPL
jgi:hypothetical protein